jgi:glycosyltransferase involved in cell wall biosynthesis
MPDDYEVSYLLTRSNRFSPPDGRLRPWRVRALRDLLPRGPVGDVAGWLVGDRYLSSDDAFDWADIVHAEELSFWFAAEAAQRRSVHRFRLVQTVWETVPFLETYRSSRARSYRRQVLDHTDLFLPTTQRAADALRLEGVPGDRICVCAPGIDTERFRNVADSDASEHVIVSAGRLVWEKGHQDVLRALAALRNRIVEAPVSDSVRLLIVGRGPEEERLRRCARELGLEKVVEFRAVPYEEMPGVLASASAMVLGSLPFGGNAYHPFDVPRTFWEEQFGLVLAEAMAAGLDIIATTSGAIPEVLRGSGAALVAPGDWIGIARALAAGPLAGSPGQRVEYPAEIVERYSLQAAARRLADVYASLLRA